MTRRIFILALLSLLIPFVSWAASVVPSSLDLQGNPGEEIKSTFTILNVQNTTQTYYLDTLAFAAKDESNEPQFSERTQGTIADWIQFATDHVDVPARTKVEVPFSVMIPGNATSGSFQTAITVSSAPSEVVATNGAILEAKTAILVFVTVSGDTQKKAALLDFLSSSSGFQTNLHQSFTYRIQNQGNVYFVPRGRVTYKDIFGRVIETRDANPEQSRVLPKTTHRFQITGQTQSSDWKQEFEDEWKKFAIGPIAVSLSLMPGEGYEPIQARYSFWYLPSFPLLTIGLMIVAIVVITFFLRKFKKT